MSITALHTRDECEGMEPHAHAGMRLAHEHEPTEEGIDAPVLGCLACETLPPTCGRCGGIGHTGAEHRSVVIRKAIGQYRVIERRCCCGGTNEEHQRTFTPDGSRIACFHAGAKYSGDRLGAIEPVCECRAFVRMESREVTA